MIETMPTAVCAILKAISDSERGSMGQDEIDYEVFYGLADLKLLKRVLKEMKSDKLVTCSSYSGAYSATDAGMAFLESNTKDWKRNNGA